ncbi:uncharacterized [Tachysurus ichikawai]
MPGTVQYGLRVPHSGLPAYFSFPSASTPVMTLEEHSVKVQYREVLQRDGLRSLNLHLLKGCCLKQLFPLMDDRTSTHAQESLEKEFEESHSIDCGHGGHMAHVMTSDSRILYRVTS